MNATNFDRLIRLRLTKADMKQTYALRASLAAALCERLNVAHYLNQLSDEEVFQLSHQKKKGNSNGLVS